MDHVCFIMPISQFNHLKMFLYRIRLILLLGLIWRDTSIRELFLFHFFIPNTGEGEVGDLIVRVVHMATAKRAITKIKAKR